MSTTVSRINVPTEIVQALDEIAESMSITREESLRIAVMRFLDADRALKDLRTSLQAAARERGIETEEQLSRFLADEQD
ncbi:MAG: hypothetical protein IT335_12560 [Thermomicrobiales bacterium]|nr:hypothetical protein [Thermomicrobiales bacterium]